MSVSSIKTLFVNAALFVNAGKKSTLVSVLPWHYKIRAGADSSPSSTK